MEKIEIFTDHYIREAIRHFSKDLNCYIKIIRNYTIFITKGKNGKNQKALLVDSKHNKIYFSNFFPNISEKMVNYPIYKWTLSQRPGNSWYIIIIDNSCGDCKGWIPYLFPSTYCLRKNNGIHYYFG